MCHDVLVECRWIHYDFVLLLHIYVIYHYPILFELNKCKPAGMKYKIDIIYITQNLNFKTLIGSIWVSNLNTQVWIQSQQLQQRNALLEVTR